jgi:hypothetical protein
MQDEDTGLEPVAHSSLRMISNDLPALVLRTAALWDVFVNKSASRHTRGAFFPPAK